MIVTDQYGTEVVDTRTTRQRQYVYEGMHQNEQAEIHAENGIVVLTGFMWRETRRSFDTLHFSGAVTIEAEETEQ